MTLPVAAPGDTNPSDATDDDDDDDDDDDEYLSQEPCVTGCHVHLSFVRSASE